MYYSGDKLDNCSRYKNNCVKTSKLFKDRQNGPLETALWWTEHVLRHKGTVNLRPDRINEAWYMRRSLDVWGFLFAIGFAILTILALMIHRVVMYCFGFKKLNRNKLAKSKKSN